MVGSSVLNAAAAAATACGGFAVCRGPEGGWKHDSLGCSKVIGGWWGAAGRSLGGSEVSLLALDQEIVCPVSFSWGLPGGG